MLESSCFKSTEVFRYGINQNISLHTLGGTLMINFPQVFVLWWCHVTVLSSMVVTKAWHPLSLRQLVVTVTTESTFLGESLNLQLGPTY